MCGAQGWREGSRVKGFLVPVLGRGLTLTYSAPLDTARQSMHTPQQQAEKIHQTVVVIVRLVHSRKVVSRDAHRLPSVLSWLGAVPLRFPDVGRSGAACLAAVSRLTVLECLPATCRWLVWTFFLAAQFQEAIPWSTLRGEPSGLASMAGP